MKRIKILMFVILLLIILMSINVNSAFVINDSNDLLNAFKNDNLIRLHVIANSNSPKDQYIKRLVRNKVIGYISDYIEKGNIDLNNEIDGLNKYIDSILEMEGIDYKIKSELGLYYFPARTYDDLTLPAGRYRALKVVLGKGEGSNWWCVLLPPMCIENKKIDKSKSDKIEFRFKILDWLSERNSSNKEKNEKMDETEKDRIDFKSKIEDLSGNIKGVLNEKELFNTQVFLNEYKEFKIIHDKINLILK